LGKWKTATRILQQDTPDDFVLATGEGHSIREFVNMSFEELGIKIRWEGSGENEIGFIDSKNSDFLMQIVGSLISDSSLEKKRNHLLSRITDANNSPKIGDRIIEVRSQYFRPTEVELLKGSPFKAEKKLKWKANTMLNELVKIMIKSDLQEILRTV
jgi:GDPmannose 4,6-dehydratase